MVGLVLLITCANLASLLITRGVARQKEIAVRQALGASRWRLVRQFIIESLLLSLAGALLDYCCSVDAGRTQEVDPAANRDWTVFGLEFSIEACWLLNFGLSLLTGLLFGLIPAMKSTPTNLARCVKGSGEECIGGYRSRRTAQGTGGGRDGVDDVVAGGCWSLCPKPLQSKTGRRGTSNRARP